MLYVSFFFMANIRFAEKLPAPRAFVVDEGYHPLLDVLEAYPQVRTELSSAGYTSCYLRDHAPAVIDRIRKGVREGRVRISTNGFEHAYLVNLSVFALERLIGMGVALDREVFGVDQPGGFWPSDGLWDSTAIKPLRDNGVRWVSHGNIAKSLPGGPLYNDWRAVDLFLPFTIQGPERASIVNLPYGLGNWEVLDPAERHNFQPKLDEIRARAASGRDGFLFVKLDFETLAVYRSARRPLDNARALLERFIEDMLENPDMRFAFADDFLDAHPPTCTLSLREMPPPAVPDGRGAWTVGCEKLDSTCRQAHGYILDVEDLLAARPALRTPAVAAELEALWQRYLFAMNSEARMTNQPHMWDFATNQCTGPGGIYPTDETVLETMNHAIAALRAARELKQRLARA